MPSTCRILKRQGLTPKLAQVHRIRDLFVTIYIATLLLIWGKSLQFLELQWLGEKKSTETVNYKSHDNWGKQVHNTNNSGEKNTYFYLSGYRQQTLL